MNFALAIDNLNSGGGSSTPSIPVTSGLTLWLRSDLGVTLVSGKVSAWADQSGNSFNFAQATAGKQPAYSASGGPNGTPYLSTAGAAGPEELDCVSWLSVSEPFEMFAVARCAATAGGNNEYLIDFSTGGNDNTILHVGSSNMEFIFGSGALSAITIGQDFIINSRADSGVQIGTAVNNGTETTAAHVPPATGTGMTILNFAGGGGNSWNGRLYEVAFYSRILSSGERTSVTRYFGTRYSITVP